MSIELSHMGVRFEVPEVLLPIANLLSGIECAELEASKLHTV